MFRFQMLTKMPIIHMKLIESKKKAGKGVYSCPCYVYPDRHGTRDKPSYVMNFDLKVMRLVFTPAYSLTHRSTVR